LLKSYLNLAPSGAKPSPLPLRSTPFTTKPLNFTMFEPNVDDEEAPLSKLKPEPFSCTVCQ